MPIPPFLPSEMIISELPGTLRPLSAEMVQRYQDFFESGQMRHLSDLARQVQHMIVFSTDEFPDPDLPPA